MSVKAPGGMDRGHAKGVGKIGRLWTLLLLGVPIAAIVAFSAVLISEKRDMWQELDNLNRVFHLVQRLNVLLHQLQRERAYTVTFIVSPGDAVKADMMMQRAVTDKSYSLFLKEYSPMRRNAAFRNVTDALEKAVAELEKLNEVRSGVDSLRTGFEQTFEYFSATNSLILNAIALVPHLSGDKELSAFYLAYYHLQLLKEKAGMQRALLFRVFTLDRLLPRQHTQLKDVSSDESYSLRRFLSLAPPDIRRSWLKISTSPEVARADRMRDSALEKGPSENFGLDPALWKALQTIKIDRISDLCFLFDNQLLKLVDKRKALAENLMIKYRFANIGVIAFAFSMAAMLLQIMKKHREAEERLTINAGILENTNSELKKALALSGAVDKISPVGHLIADATGTIITANPAAEQIFGYSPGEMAGRSVKALAPSSREEEYYRYIQEYLAFKKTGLPERRNMVRVPAEVLSVKKNGEIFYSSLFVREVTIPDGEVFLGVVEDITERREAAISLSETVKNSEAIMNASSEMLALIGLEGNIIAINEAGAEGFNAKRGDLAGRSLFQLLPLEIAVRRMSFFEQAARTRSPVRFEDERDGRSFENFIHPVIQGDGEVTRCALFAADITERKKWESSLAERDIKMRAILISAPNAIILTDENGTMEMVNPAGAQIFRMAADEMVGQNVKILIPEPHKSRHDGYIEKYLRSGESGMTGHLREAACQRGDGSIFPAELYVTEIFPGIARKFLVMASDISERKAAEKALLDNMKALADAQRIAHLGNWELDLRTRMFSWSDEIFRMLGYKPGEIVPAFDKLLEFIHQDDRNTVIDALDMLINGEMVPKFSYRIAGKAGDERTIEVQGEVMERDDAGRPLTVIGTALDVTELKNLERMRDNFFQAVVHDLKSPITGLKLELEMLRSQIESFSKGCATVAECQRPYEGYEHSMKQKVADIDEGLDQLHLMIQSLLKLEEIGEDNMELHYEPFLIRDLLEDAEKEFRKRLDARKLVLKVSNAHTGMVVSDRGLLKRVLQNLLDNAIKYAIADTTIIIESIGARKEGEREYIFLSVSNIGEPLSGDRINSLFQKFKTLDHPESGSGIGLFFCYRTMQLLGGGTVVDQHGETITFQIFFPNG